jgi:peroxiredoxin
MEEKKSVLGTELESAKESFKANNSLVTVEKFGSFVNQLVKDNVAGDALKAGEPAPDFTLKNAIGKEINLKEELKSGPVILTWYRGGWCPYCNLALNFLQRHLPEFRSYGAQLLAITPETPDQSMSTKEKHNLDFEVLTDESNVVAIQYGGVHSLPDEIRDIYAKRGVGDYYRDYKNVEFPVPATYIVDRSGVIRFVFAESDYRKRAEPTDIIDALKELQD